MAAGSHRNKTAEKNSPLLMAVDYSATVPRATVGRTFRETRKGRKATISIIRKKNLFHNQVSY